MWPEIIASGVTILVLDRAKLLGKIIRLLSGIYKGSKLGKDVQVALKHLLVILGALI